MNNSLLRCDWCFGDDLYLKYHDEEWGVPLFDSEKLFEFLLLEGFQAGLSWITILRRRENYRLLFDQFNPEKIAQYNEAKIESLMLDSRIIRNQLKIRSAVSNAQAYLDMSAKGLSFSAFVWQFVEGQPRQNRFQTLAEIPSQTPESQRMSRELRKAGFRFVGPTICYAFMQATGMVNDHLLSCHRYTACNKGSVNK